MSFNNKVLELAKEHLNFTHSCVNISDIEVAAMYFIFFNDADERLEFHSDKHYEFVKNGVLNGKTKAFSIKYEDLDNRRIKVEYTGIGEIVYFEIGSMRPIYKIFKGDKQTSHSIAGEYKGLFTVKDGFKQYIADLGGDEIMDGFLNT